MSRAMQRYLHFKVNGKVYQFTCLPFGLATSPKEFTKLLRPVVSLLLLQGVRLHVYLDDWLIKTLWLTQAKLHANLVIWVLQHLGWIINFDKSDPMPTMGFSTTLPMRLGSDLGRYGYAGSDCGCTGWGSFLDRLVSTCLDFSHLSCTI